MAFSCSVTKKSVLLVISSAVVVSEVVLFFYDLYVRKRDQKLNRRVLQNRKKILAKPKPNGENLQAPRAKKELVPFTNPVNIEVKPELLSEDDIWNTAFFFPDYFPDRANSTTQKFVWYLQQTQRIMKICMYVSSFRILEKAVFGLAKDKGVHVMAVTNVPRVVHQWRRNGVMIREKPKVIRSAFSKDIFVDVMHHKFIIIDDKAVIGGSLNWTRSGISENRENIVVTNNPCIVNKFVHEFDRIWELSEPEKGCNRNNSRFKNNGKVDNPETTKKSNSN